MSSNTLSGAGVTPANTKAQLLHIGTGSASVCTVRTGDGTATALAFVAGGAKITGTFEVTTNLVVGGTLTLTGALTCAANITGLNTPVYKVIAAADISNSSATVYSDLTEFSFTPVSGATYEFELCMLWVSTVTGTGIVVKNNGGSVTGSLMASHDQALLNMGSEVIYSTSPYASPTKFGYMAKGFITASATTPITWQIRSEVGGSAVILYKGSFLKITRIS